MRNQNFIQQYIHSFTFLFKFIQLSRRRQHSRVDPKRLFIPRRGYDCWLVFKDITKVKLSLETKVF